MLRVGESRCPCLRSSRLVAVPRLPARRRPSSEERSVGLLLAAGRLAIGAGIWLAPGPSLKALGFDAPDGQALTLARMAGARDLILGAWQASSLSDRSELGRATIAITAADACDVIAFAAVTRSGGPLRASVLGLAGAVPATALGAWLAARLRG